MLDVLKENLINTALAMCLFVLAYMANMCFALWLNIGLLQQPFEPGRLKRSAIKVAAIIIGLALTVTVITVLPLFAAKVGWTISPEFEEVFAGLVIVSIALYTACRYIFEAVGKFRQIMDFDRKDAS